MWKALANIEYGQIGYMKTGEQTDCHSILVEGVLKSWSKKKEGGCF